MDEDRIAIERGEEAVEEREEQLGYSSESGTSTQREEDTGTPEILETRSADEVADDTEPEPKLSLATQRKLNVNQSRK